MFEVIYENGGRLTELKENDSCYDLHARGIRRVVTDMDGKKSLTETQ